MSDDEQGYAPASYLEPLEESSSVQDVHPEDMTNQGEWVWLTAIIKGGGVCIITHNARMCACNRSKGSVRIEY